MLLLQIAVVKLPASQRSSLEIKVNIYVRLLFNDVTDILNQPQNMQTKSGAFK